MQPARGRGGGSGKGGRERRGGRGGDDKMVHLSKLLSSILRHNAVKMGLKIGTDGFMLVSDILAHQQVARGGYTVDDVKAVVASNDKQRFSLLEREGRLYIRANQGHSLSVPDLDLKPITDASPYPVVVHGTYNDVISLILKDGLNRMGRTHIHFAQGEFGSAEVISGMRRTCDVLVYIDLARCIRDGIPFVVSANGVILSTGDAQGYVKPQYFREVLSTSTRQRVAGFVPAPAAAVVASPAPAAAAAPASQPTMPAAAAPPPAAAVSPAPAPAAAPASTLSAPASTEPLSWAARVAKK